jgi:hypothetical protein
MKFKNITAIILIFFSMNSQAESVKGLSFDLKKEIKCHETELGMHCLSPDKGIIINLTIQKRDKGDNLIKYKKHLEKNISKGKYASKMNKTAKVFLNGRQWISSNHYQSEFLKYFTQYYACVKGENAYLISVSYKPKSLNKNEISIFSKSLKFI